MMAMELRAPVPNATLTTLPMAAMRTPSARERVARKTTAAADFMRAPNRFSKSW